MTRTIEIVEVGPRDGLQNESQLVSTADKITLIERAIGYGARRIEATSFVNPRLVPQMADAAELVAALPDRPDVTYIGLVLNRRGAERALATRIHELGTVAVASDAFAMRNQGQTSAESLTIARDIVGLARTAGRSAQITIAAAFGCPYQGEVPTDHVIAMAARAAEAGPREIALADTIGVATPEAVRMLVGRVLSVVAPIPVRVHFHNTRGTGIANVWAAVEAGAMTVDAALGGLGGCPFAPGAAGNVATEEVIYMLSRSGVETGFEFHRLVESSAWLARVMGRSLPSTLTRAPIFPPLATAGSI